MSIDRLQACFNHNSKSINPQYNKYSIAQFTIALPTVHYNVNE